MRNCQLNRTKPVLQSRQRLRAAEVRVNGALVRCEETLPQSGPNSVLLGCLDRDAANWRENTNGMVLNCALNFVSTSSTRLFCFANGFVWQNSIFSHTTFLM
jgi:hypothetical protein